MAETLDAMDTPTLSGEASDLMAGAMALAARVQEKANTLARALALTGRAPAIDADVFDLAAAILAVDAEVIRQAREDLARLKAVHGDYTPGCTLSDALYAALVRLFATPEQQAAYLRARGWKLAGGGWVSPDGKLDFMPTDGAVNVQSKSDLEPFRSMLK